MPQFEPQAVNTADLDDIAEGFLQAAEFTMDEEYSGKQIRGWTKAAKANAAKAVKRFLAAAAPDDVAAYREHYQPSHGYSIDQCMGHDIWYTSNHHGVGFWDRDYPSLPDGEGKALGERLSEAAHKLSERDVWLNRGWLSFD